MLPHGSTGKRSAPDRVLDAASEFFQVRGVDGTGVDAISDRSGVSKSTLYRHFPTKADLVAAYLRRHHEGRIAEWAAVLREREGTPRERLVALFDWLEEWIAGRNCEGCRFINAAIQLRDPTHPAFAIPAAHKRKIWVLLTETATEAGALRPRELADQLLLIIDGAFIRTLMDRDPDAARRARQLAELALAAGGLTEPAAVV